MSYIPLFPGFKPTTLIGRGASARVYLAIQESLERPVALKIMPSEQHGDDHFSHAFLHESRLLAQLHHPHIVPIYDIGQADGHLFIAMEYVPGGTLRDRMKMGLRVSEALKIIRELAKALAFAHGKGLVHRDIKPDNVMLREDNSAVLMDFGITLDTTRDDNPPSDKVLGSPNYMSPEHHYGQPLDARSDLYSLGVAFYQILTGKLPFTGSTPRELAQQKTSLPVPNLPDELTIFQPIINRLLESNADLRYQSALQLLQDMKQLRYNLGNLSRTSTPEPSMSNTPRPAKLAARLDIKKARYWSWSGRKWHVTVEAATDDFTVFDGYLNQIIEALLALQTKNPNSIRQLQFHIQLHPWIQGRVRDRLKSLRQNQALAFLKKTVIEVTIQDENDEPLEQFQLPPER